MDSFNSSQLSNPNCLEKRVTDAGEVSLLLAISFAVNERRRSDPSVYSLRFSYLLWKSPYILSD